VLDMEKGDDETGINGEFISSLMTLLSSIIVIRW
jgi:hypothetical protein